MSTMSIIKSHCMSKFRHLGTLVLLTIRVPLRYTFLLVAQCERIYEIKCTLFKRKYNQLKPTSMVANVPVQVMASVTHPLASVPGVTAAKS